MSIQYAVRPLSDNWARVCAEKAEVTSIWGACGHIYKWERLLCTHTTTKHTLLSKLLATIGCFLQVSFQQGEGIPQAPGKVSVGPMLEPLEKRWFPW